MLQIRVIVCAGFGVVLVVGTIFFACESAVSVDGAAFWDYLIAAQKVCLALSKSF